MQGTNHILVDQYKVGKSTVSSYVPEYYDVAEEDIVHGSPEPVIEDRGDHWTVWFDWSKVIEVDHPRQSGISTGDGKRGLALAQRLAAATRAGAVHYDAYRAKANDGSTIIHSSTRVMGRHLNADLRRIGF